MVRVYLDRAAPHQDPAGVELLPLIVNRDDDSVAMEFRTAHDSKIEATRLGNLSHDTDEQEDLTETIVVGVDGSPGSLRALSWAAEEARLRNARLHAVMAWDAPVRVLGGAWVIPNEIELAEYGKRALERLETVMQTQAAELADLDVELSAVHGAPAEVLLQAAQGASELVVGSRGHGDVAGLLLGSVSRHCSHHAPCPVVIVPWSAVQAARAP